MNIEVFLAGVPVPKAYIRHRTVIVLDILRACSTIVTALSNGARSVIPVADMSEGTKIASRLERGDYLLGGERGAYKIHGYHLGNSPLEYTRSKVEGRTVILNTTNGTGAINHVRGAKHLLVGCFLNVGRVVDFIRKSKEDLTIVCAGSNPGESLEDILCAGLILSRIWRGQWPRSISDAAYVALTQYEHGQNNLHGVLREASHSRRLVEKGFGADVDYCLGIDTLPSLPYYLENRLVLRNP